MEELEKLAQAIDNAIKACDNYNDAKRDAFYAKENLNQAIWDNKDIEESDKEYEQALEEQNKARVEMKRSAVELTKLLGLDTRRAYNDPELVIDKILYAYRNGTL